MDEDREAAIAKIKASAREHGGRYLLQRRFKPAIGAPLTDNDRLWEAAEALVNRGEAHWLSPYNTFHPGIRLTRRGEE